MKVNDALKPISEYLILISRDTVNGWYEMEVGFPKSWIFKGNNNVDCEILNENDIGKLVKIKPISEKIVIDDLISFILLIIETNQKIVEKEKSFTERIERIKVDLEKEVSKFQDELEKLKEKSFNDLSNEFDDEIKGKKESTKRGRPKKNTTEENKVDNETKEE